MFTTLCAQSARAQYEFIKAHRKQYSAPAMGRVLGGAPSGCYEWGKHPLSNRAIEAAPLLRLIRASGTGSQGIYGAPQQRTP